MIRVLHLFSRQPTLQTEHGVSLLTDPTRNEFQSATSTIGRGGQFRSVLGAGAALRFAHSGLDLIHAWDPPAFVAAVASGLPVVFSPTVRVKRGSWSWLATAAYADVHVVSPTAWACDQQVKSGLPAERCHVVVPGLESTPGSINPDPDLRDRLAISASQFVILAPGESSRAARHRVAWHAAAILRVLDERFRLLIWGRGPEAQLVRNLSVRVQQADLVIDAEKRLGREVSFEELAGAADAALVTGSSDASLLPAAVCASAGLPIVATESAAIREAFGTNEIAVVARKDVRTLSQRLLELHEHPEQRARLGAAAKARAARVFDPHRFVGEYSRLYQHIVERHHYFQGKAVAPEHTPAQTAVAANTSV
jgi:glycosyltransferase involved in cell wall biosynthesis